MFLEIDLGPFAPVVGYIGAILAAVYSIWTLIWGRQNIWETPQDIIPKKARGMLGILLGIGMVYLWLDINPNNVSDNIKSAAWMGVIAVISFILYFAFLRIFTYKKEEVVTERETQTIKIVGGLWLKKSAKEFMKIKNEDSIQNLFKRSQYNEDRLWTRFSQELSKSIIVIFFLIIVACGTLGLTTAGFIVQVKLTNKPASEIIQTNDSPGLKESK